MLHPWHEKTRWTDEIPRLSNIALLVLTIPHSNAAEESLLPHKEKTAFRPNLDAIRDFGKYCHSENANGEWWLATNMIFHWLSSMQQRK